MGVSRTRTVSSTIYVARPDLLELGNDVDHDDLQGTLEKEIVNATEVTIFGGFYSVEPLIRLCATIPKRSRKNCRIRIVVGLDTTASIPTTWDDMRRVRSRLLAEKFVDPIVAIVDSRPVHFHTKLFRFMHRTHPVWFIGSANPGSARHELMVRFGGRHDALSAYIRAVLAKAVDVGSVAINPRIHTLRDFFMAGVLCHRPRPPRLFTFDAFQIKPTHRDQLSAALAGSAGVSHASPETNGFGFSLLSALEKTESDQPRPSNAAADRTALSPYSIDTVFGRWMPSAYADRVRGRIVSGDLKRAQRLMMLGSRLQDHDGLHEVRRAFLEHVTSMEAFLSAHQIDAREIPNRMQRFEAFIAARIRSLTNPEAVERYARSVMLTAMPDIWADESAVQGFEDSFFDDLAFRADAKTKPAVVRSIVDWLDNPRLVTGEDVRRALEAGLTEVPWTENDWA